MPLNKSVISLPFQQGLDTAQAPALVDNSRYLELTNAVFDRGSLGQIHKRAGYTGYSLTDSKGYALSSLNTLGVFNNEQLCLGRTSNPAVYSQQLFGYGEADTSWNNRGTIQSITESERIISNTGVSVSAVDMASGNGVSVYAWVSNSGVYSKIVDEVTGSTYNAHLRKPLGNLSAKAVRVIAGASNIFVFILDTSGNISIFSVSTSNPGAGLVNVASDVITGISANTGFDACYQATYLIVVGCNSTGVVAWNMAETAPDTIVTGPITLFAGSNTGVVCCSPHNSTLVMAAAVTGAFSSETIGTAKLKAVYFTAAGISLGTVYSANIQSTGGKITGVPRIGCVQDPGLFNSTITQALVYEVSTTVGTGLNATVGQPQIAVSIVNENVGFLLNSIQAITCNLATTPFVLKGQLYIGAVFPSKYQQTLFLLSILPDSSNLFGNNTSFQVVGKYLNAGYSGPAPTQGLCLPRPQKLASDSTGNTWALGTTKGLINDSVNGSPVTIFGVAEITMDFNPERVSNTQLGTGVFAAGSLVYGYDGQGVNELGFNVYPEAPTVTWNTSQIQIVTNAFDPTWATTTCDWSIYIPDNGANPGGAMGNQITPGEYFVVNAYFQGGNGPINVPTICFYFQVNGQGSNPIWTNSYPAILNIPINISSNSTASEVALIVFNALQTNIGYPYYPYVGSYTVNFPIEVNQGGTNNSWMIECRFNAYGYTTSPPAMNREFTVIQAFSGSASAPCQTVITACPASLITGGQYFILSLIDVFADDDPTPTYQTYVWFNVAGQGTDPKPALVVPGVAALNEGVEVTLAGTETEWAVASLIGDAIVTAFPSMNGTATTQGNTLVITSGTVGFGTVSVPAYSNNPSIGGVEQGYAGANTTGSPAIAVLQFSSVYEWFSGQGELNQSAPSFPTLVYVPTYITQTLASVPSGTSTQATANIGSTTPGFTQATITVGTTPSFTVTAGTSFPGQLGNELSLIVNTGSVLSVVQTSGVLITITLGSGGSTPQAIQTAFNTAISPSVASITSVTGVTAITSGNSQTSFAGGIGTSNLMTFTAGTNYIGAAGNVLNVEMVQASGNFIEPGICTAVINGNALILTIGGASSSTTPWFCTTQVGTIATAILNAGIPSTFMTFTGTGTSLATYAQLTYLTGGITNNSGFAGNGIIIPGAAIQPNEVFTVGMQNLYLTQKEQLGATIGLALYQTQSNGSVFYRLTNPLSPVANVSTSLIPTTFIANQGDSPTISGLTSSPTKGIASNEPLYTTGGVLENDGPPCASIVCNHQDRIFISGLEDPQLIYFTEEYEPGQALAFNSESGTIRLNANIGQIACGPITGLASMDSNLIVFQENAVQYISGSGPDDTGSNGLFNVPQLVQSSTAVGCRDPGSIVLLPQGLIFKSNQGWYLLNRSLQLQPIGKPVQAYNNQVCTRGLAVPNSTSVVLLAASGGNTLTYDWYYDSWGTFSNHTGLDICIGPNGYSTYLNDVTGIVQYQTPGLYSDANTGGFPMTIQTAWLKFQNVQGFQAIWWNLLKGYFLGTQPYQVQIAYNYNPTIVDTFIYQPLAGTSNAGLWGSGIWGANTWGSSNPVIYNNSYQFRFMPSQVHCESMQITITELAPFNTNSTWSLDSLDMEVGIRKGAYKSGFGSGNSIG